ncbi:hypothetical protein TSUD_160950 [Trifolium subterraneum]|uniref:Uncharacterized protein n=1 Tax=Trifolium subterraneum TaxID=3900 RepID=A0A2Z6N1R0_TRISU|nr:hypothetical protein TSUD_160950 [Trifolium subterraneum]
MRTKKGGFQGNTHPLPGIDIADIPPLTQCALLLFMMLPCPQHVASGASVGNVQFLLEYVMKSCGGGLEKLAEMPKKRATTPC